MSRTSIGRYGLIRSGIAFVCPGASTGCRRQTRGGTVLVQEVPVDKDQPPLNAICICIGVVIALLCPGSVGASDEQLALSRMANGHVIATLTGMKPPCSWGAGGKPTVEISGKEIRITLRIVDMACPTSVDDKSRPYSETADLGVLANGTYKLRWEFAGNPPQLQAQISFTVCKGELIK